MIEPANLRNSDDPATGREFHHSWLGTVVVGTGHLLRTVGRSGVAAVEALTRTGRLDPSDIVVCLLTGSGFRDVGGLQRVIPVLLTADSGPDALDRVLSL